MNITRRQAILRSLTTFGLAAVVAVATVPTAAVAAGAAERYVIELRVIEGERNGEPMVDKRLASMSKDLKNLPFKRFTLKDAHTSLVADGERVSLEIPDDTGGLKKGKNKRFLEVSAHGRQAGGKLRFSLAIDALKFETLVAVPNGGTIIVGGPRGKDGKAVLFAFTAKARKN